MARRPVRDERSVLPKASNSPKKERFFTAEIASFLRARPCDVLRLLRRQNLLRELKLGTGRAPRRWTTRRGLEICIAHFRALLGEQYLRGKDALRTKDVNYVRTMSYLNRRR